MTFIHSGENTGTITNLLQFQGKIKCAVAFLGLASIELLRNSSPETKIICNLESGATNPYAIEQLITLGIQVKTIGNLHTKVYLVEGEQAVVGSANLSANGLSYEDGEVNGWLEAGVLVKDKETLAEINTWFDMQWEVALEITPSLIENTKKLWERKRNKRVTANNNNSILELLRNHPEDFKDKNIFIAIYRSDTPSEGATEKFEEVKNTFTVGTVGIDFFENWEGLPEDSYFISIYYGPREGIKIDKYYYLTFKKNKNISISDESSITLLSEERSIDGMVLTTNDRSIFDKTIVGKLWDLKAPKEESDGMYISLYDAREIIFGE